MSDDSAQAIRLDADSVTANIDRVMDALSHAGSDLVLIAGDLVINPAVLAPVTENPFAGTCAAVRRSRDGNLRVVHHYLVAAGTSFHEVNTPNAVSVGAIRLALRDHKQILPVMRELREFSLVSNVYGNESIELIVTALLRAQVQIKEVELIDAPWFRSPQNVEQANVDIQSQSDTTIRRLQANRIDDG